MPLSEYDTKEALRAATDWLEASELPGSAAAREGIADTVPLVMMGLVEPDDLDDLAAIVEKHGRACTMSCTAAILLLFDHPVGAAKQRKRYCRAECLSGCQMERWKRFLSTRTSSLMRCNNCA